MKSLSSKLCIVGLSLFLGAAPISAYAEDDETPEKKQDDSALNIDTDQVPSMVILPKEKVLVLMRWIVTKKAEVSDLETQLEQALKRIEQLQKATNCS